MHPCFQCTFPWICLETYPWELLRKDFCLSGTYSRCRQSWRPVWYYGNHVLLLWLLNFQRLMNWSYNVLDEFLDEKCFYYAGHCNCNLFLHTVVFKLRLSTGLQTNFFPPVVFLVFHRIYGERKKHKWGHAWGWGLHRCTYSSYCLQNVLQSGNQMIVVNPSQKW